MEHRYGEITEQTIKKLMDVVGKDNVFTKKDEIEAYSYDEMPLAKHHIPQVVVKPNNVQSINRLMRFANEKRIPITPRGAGTGLSGGCVPIYGGILLSLERMNKILEIDPENFVAVVEPGVTLSDLCHQVEQQGLNYPLHPGEMTATVGGNICTNAGGMNAIKYGVTRHNVLGLEVVMPNGEIIRTGGKFVKCSTGYDLTQLIIGSEGTLAVVTKAILKLTMKPKIAEVLFIPFMDLQNAIDAVPDIMKLKMIPTSIEFMEKSIIELVEKYQNIEIPHHQHAAYLMITVEGESEDDIYEYFSEVEEICRRHEAIEATIPGGNRAKRKLIDARENFFHAIKQHAPMTVIDVVVPRRAIGEFVRKVKEISEDFQIPIIVYGHAGDGNVHLHPICLNMDRGEWHKKLPDLMRRIYHIGISLGGAISGEHGIGYDKKAYFKQETDIALFNTMKAIKKAFDPCNILNPGKIFDL
ncbi:FAD-binding oxidoreductase [Chloroflexota bacterium]